MNSEETFDRYSPATFPTAPENSLENSNKDGNSHAGKRDMDISKLDGRVCYFSLAGDQALKAFEEEKMHDYDKNEDSEKYYQKLKKQVLERFYFAVIMFDHVILHCSDPLRSPLIKDILSEHLDWIRKGWVAFIANKDITDWNKDYKSYIDRKIRTYESSAHAKAEAASLKQPHITPEYMQAVVEILNQSPYLLRKSLYQNNQFTSLLRNDIKQNVEPLAIDPDFEADQDYSFIGRAAVEKTVFQLLHMRQFARAGEEIKYIFDKSKIDPIIATVRKTLSRNEAIARSTFVTAIHDAFSESGLNDIQKEILSAVTLRIDLLYCKMNAGKHIILEFHPSYEDQSIYKLVCFDFYLSKFSKGASLQLMSKEIVEKLVSSRQIDEFRYYFLAIMADVHEYFSFTIHNDTLATIFSDRCNRLLTSDGMCRNFNEIRKILVF